MVNILLSTSLSNIQYHIDKNWVYNFIKHYKDLKMQYSQRYNYEHVKCEDLKIIYK